MSCLLVLSFSYLIAPPRKFIWPDDTKPRVSVKRSAAKACLAKLGLVLYSGGALPTPHWYELVEANDNEGK